MWSERRGWKLGRADRINEHSKKNSVGPTQLPPSAFRQAILSASRSDGAAGNIFLASKENQANAFNQPVFNHGKNHWH
jgi:hypothetical protein